MDSEITNIEVQTFLRVNTVLLDFVEVNILLHCMIYFLKHS